MLFVGQAAEIFHQGPVGSICLCRRHDSRDLLRPFTATGNQPAVSLMLFPVKDGDDKQGDKDYPRRHTHTDRNVPEGNELRLLTGTLRLEQLLFGAENQQATVLFVLPTICHRRRVHISDRTFPVADAGIIASHHRIKVARTVRHHPGPLFNMVKGTVDHCLATIRLACFQITVCQPDIDTRGKAMIALRLRKG